MHSKRICLDNGNAQQNELVRIKILGKDNKFLKINPENLANINSKQKENPYVSQGKFSQLKNNENLNTLNSMFISNKNNSVVKQENLINFKNEKTRFTPSNPLVNPFYPKKSLKEEKINDLEVQINAENNQMEIVKKTSNIVMDPNHSHTSFLNPFLQRNSEAPNFMKLKKITTVRISDIFSKNKKYADELYNETCDKDSTKAQLFLSKARHCLLSHENSNIPLIENKEYEMACNDFSKDFSSKIFTENTNKADNPNFITRTAYEEFDKIILESISKIPKTEENSSRLSTIKKTKSANIKQQECLAKTIKRPFELHSTKSSIIPISTNNKKKTLFEESATSNLTAISSQYLKKVSNNGNNLALSAAELKSELKKQAICIDNIENLQYEVEKNYFFKTPACNRNNNNEYLNNLEINNNKDYLDKNHHGKENTSKGLNMIFRSELKCYENNITDSGNKHLDSSKNSLRSKKLKNSELILLRESESDKDNQNQNKMTLQKLCFLNSASLKEQKKNKKNNYNYYLDIPGVNYEQSSSSKSDVSFDSSSLEESKSNLILNNLNSIDHPLSSFSSKTHMSEDQSSLSEVSESETECFCSCHSRESLGSVFYCNPSSVKLYSTESSECLHQCKDCNFSSFYKKFKMTESDKFKELKLKNILKKKKFNSLPLKDDTNKTNQINSHSIQLLIKNFLPLKDFEKDLNEIQLSEFGLEKNSYSWKDTDSKITHPLLPDDLRDDEVYKKRLLNFLKYPQHKKIKTQIQFNLKRKHSYKNDIIQADFNGNYSKYYNLLGVNMRKCASVKKNFDSLYCLESNKDEMQYFRFVKDTEIGISKDWQKQLKIGVHIKNWLLNNFWKFF